ncbi:branched-chain amino acid transaminase [Leptospira montravelensis]|uniref:Branched-chain-amino-acid aminotransferase n=1 Tax=Leptospira montravelensis TaxID=2484961 RepID=A0ABY2LRN0_9LEPT|nr:branched-chain amino acid transaminase [Leptospira montravelensis]TGK80558.1 branched-chain amino acid transaminase [Leptospira montravelensis]TGL00736.1 branched-chain amino acid transaminase [Leptospira montravelensis]
MAQNSFPYTYFEGKIVPSEDAKVSVQTHALQYGTGVFGGIRGYYNEAKKNLFVFRLPEHCKRLENSTKIMQLQIQITPEEIQSIILDLLRKNEAKQNVYLRPFIYTSALQLSPRFHDVKADITVYALKLDDYLDTQNGLTTIVSSWQRFSDNQIPTLSKVSGGYVNSALAKSEAVQNGMDEAIFLDARGFVSEGSAENLFIVRDGVIHTPTIPSSILEGITRRSIIQIAKDLGIQVVERDIARSELYIADELFFSGTGVQVAWVKEVDRRVIGNGNIGPITKKIQSIFFEAVRGEQPSYMNWLTPVY